MSITLIYHVMSLTVLYQYHLEKRYVYQSDLSCYVSDYCISITKKRDTYITVIYHTTFDYCISITRKCDRSITVIYHATSLTTVSISLGRVIGLSQ
jgi:hypothetical protein